MKTGCVYHVISRFVAREWFVESAAERNAYTSLLGLSIAQTDWRCFAYAVMSNHIHLGVVAGTERLCEWLGPMHSDFAEWINERKDRIGGVFVRGPNVVAYQPAGVAHLINYIHRNPVRAGVVDTPGESDWTSHRAYAGTSFKPNWLDVACALELTGFDSGRALAKWIDAQSTDREELDAFRSTPRRGRGRPRREPR